MPTRTKQNGTAPKGAGDTARANGNGKKKLTAKRQLFVEALIPANGNATEAARRAGLKHPGQQGHRLLKNVEIQEAVEGRLESAKKCMGADEVLAHLTDVAEAAWRDFCEVHYDKENPDEVWSVKMRLTDKLKALELLAKHHKLLTDNLVISGKLSLLDAIRGADDGG